MEHPPPTDAVSIGESFQLAWAVIWPLALLDIVVWLPRDNLGLGQKWVETVGLLSGAASLFLVLPWVIRRLVRANFHGFHVEVLRPSGEQTRHMAYNESLSVAWLLLWRVGVVLAVIELIIWLAQGARAGDNPFDSTAHPGLAGLGQLLLGEALSLALFAAWIMRAAIAKHYRTFSLGVQKSA